MEALPSSSASFAVEDVVPFSRGNAGPRPQGVFYLSPWLGWDVGAPEHPQPRPFQASVRGAAVPGWSRHLDGRLRSALPASRNGILRKAR